MDAKTYIPTPTPTSTGEIPVNERSEFAWIVAGGSFLSTCAGFINVISILSTMSMTVTHNTGVTSKMAINFTKFNISAGVYQFGILFAYLMGSTFIGSLIKKEKFHYSRKYGILLMIECVILMVSANLYVYENKWGVILASFAMGLQNALFTNFSGAVVRTTHVTGLLTDIGIHLGHYLRWREKTKEFWRLKVLFPLFMGFVIGGSLATISFEILGVYSMYIPAITLGIGGAIWTFKRLRFQNVVAIKSNKERLLV